MSSDSLKNKLAQVFEQDYQGYEYFVENVVRNIFTGDDAYEPLDIPEDFLSDENRKRANDSGILQIQKVGTIDAEEPIDLFDITLSDKKELQYNRVGIQQFIRSSLFPFTNAFMLFHNETPKNKDWRFSFAYKESTIKGMTSAKRYTYLFGKSHRARTASERFAKLADEEKTSENLLAAFSVEALSDDFFNEYKNQYNVFCKFMTEHKNDPNFFGNRIAYWEDKSLRDYVKKMMGRITFIYFLQRKGWMCGDMQYMQNAFKTSPYQDDYLDTFLEPLFFGVLNTKEKEREGLFKEEGWDLSLLKEWKSIPYLNGGLFERDEQDEPKSKFPADMFKQLFDFYSRYNFTIDENDPDDAEVGVDPEMLGRIFENLLEDNKDKGAFYTPKEIVQYMSEESIAQYLKTHTEESLHSAIDELIKEKKVPETMQGKAVATTLYKLLSDVKVCDPAIGSGAFPMGVLNVLYHTRLLLYGFTKPTQVFSPAEVKREIIQNNIYGVDIEKGAVDIARLRFWLALVVDEIEPETLPNLDFKIMQGNSLLESYEGVNLSRFTHTKKEADYDDKNAQCGDLFFDNSLPEKLRTLLKEYYDCDKHEQKIKIREAIIGNVRMQVPNLSTSIDLMENDKFFLWHTWFADVFEKGGFDVVIGNPPYVDAKKLKKIAGSLKHYQVFCGAADLYTYFNELGFRILTKHGILTFITSNKWIRSEYGRNLRKMFIDNNILKLIDFGRNRLFGATVDSSIFLIKKDRQAEEPLLYYFDDNTNCNSLLDTLENSLVDGIKLTEEAWLLKAGENELIRNKMESSGVPLKELGVNIYRGILTGCNDAFHINTLEKDKLVSKDCENAAIIKPLIFGNDTTKYYCKSNNMWLINIHNGIKKTELKPIDINAHPSLKQRLDGYYDSLVKRNDKGFTPYNLRNCAYLKEFEKEKIIWQAISKRISFSYDADGHYYCDVTTYFMTGRNLKYLLAIMNSKLYEYALLKIYLEDDTFKSKNAIIQSIPIPAATPEQQRPIIELIDKILAALKANPQADTSAWEKEIDKLVYELYGLTEEEIKVVEGK